MKLRELRQNHNLTQQNVAEYLDCSVANYSRYEIGLRQPSIEILSKLADLYYVSVDYLIGRSSHLDDWKEATVSLSQTNGFKTETEEILKDNSDDLAQSQEIERESNHRLNLTLREAALIEAYRNADPRARNDSLNLLLIHDSRTASRENLS